MCSVILLHEDGPDSFLPFSLSHMTDFLCILEQIICCMLLFVQFLSLHMNKNILLTGYEGYAGDSSDSADECDWLQDLDMRRPSLPKFWLIMKVNQGAVTTYFHCRCDDV